MWCVVIGVFCVEVVVVDDDVVEDGFVFGEEF